MRFWDSSALVPLIVEERRSVACRKLFRSDPVVGVWLLTRIEIVSSLRRKERAGEMHRAEIVAALRRLEIAHGRWTEVDEFALVSDYAERLLATHPLAAADALQLGAALVLANGQARRREFVSSDEQLAAAAEIEGFSVIVPL